jgi:hypothetical protein
MSSESGPFHSSPNKRKIATAGHLMSIGALQKGSLAVLVWFILFFSTSAVVQRLAATVDGHSPIDVAPPLPVWAYISVYAVPTIVTGILVFLYLRGTRQSLKSIVLNRFLK